MPQARKKPVVIEYVTWQGKYTDGTEWPDWFRARVESTIVQFRQDGKLVVKTMEGDHLADIGDQIIQGVKGELYPCKPDIFAATYDLESASACPPPPSCSACGGDTAMRLVCTKCYSVVGGFEKSPPTEADLARIAVRHFPVKLESQLGIVKKDVNAEGRAACLAALREACGMEVPNG